jgi:tetratricopeptide (TPR) repeat protein
MTLEASLKRELEIPDLSQNARAELSCAFAHELENKGDYEEARKALSHYWPRIGENPNVYGLEPGAAAELLLRAGALTGIIGGQRQIANAQETAKDLITQSHSIFESRQNKKKVAEALTELALCYWRTDDLSEARACLEEALALVTIDCDLKAKAILRLSIVEHAAGRDHKAFRLLTKHAPLFQRINNHTLKGCYFSALGDRLENLGESRKDVDYIDRALIEYAAASYHLELAGHRPYFANVEANLGFLYFKINRFADANEHLDRARRIYVSLKDARTVAQVDETRARIFLAQGRLLDAERAARSAVRMQEKGGNAFLTTEALVTYGRVLARSDRYVAALSTFRRAFELSERAGLGNRAAEAAVSAFREIGEHLAVADRGQLHSGRALVQDRLSRERHVIELALEQANGKVSEAARILGTSWQGLGYALRTRHQDLLNKRTPVRTRKRKTKAQ